MNIYRCSPLVHGYCPDRHYCGEDATYCAGSWCDRFNDAVEALMENDPNAETAVCDLLVESLAGGEGDG